MKFARSDRFFIHVATALVRDNIRNENNAHPVWLIHPTSDPEHAVLVHGARLPPSQALSVPLAAGLADDTQTIVSMLVVQDDVQVQLEREGNFVSLEEALADGRVKLEKPIDIIKTRGFEYVCGSWYPKSD